MPEAHGRRSARSSRQRARSRHAAAPPPAPGRTHRRRRSRSSWVRPGLVAAAVAVAMASAVAAERGQGSDLVLRSGSSTAGTAAGTAASGASAAPATTARVSAGPRTTGPATTGPATTARATTARATGPSGVPVPVGDLAGWHQVFHDDFSTPVAQGSFPGTAYGRTWTGYEDLTDASGTGHYATTQITSVHDGELDVHLRRQGGRDLLAAPEPMVGGTATGRAYGRYDVRYRSDAVAGHTLAFVLWPDSNDWSDGEIAYPQGSAGGAVSGEVHCPGEPRTSCLSATAGVSSAGWHTATTEWTPTGVTFLLDGKQVGHTATSPTAPMHWVLQTSTDGSPSASASGHVLVDWVAAYSRA